MAWRIWYPATGTCTSCGRLLHLNPYQACRLCWTQAKYGRPDAGPVDVIAGNRFGQQLMFADMSSPKNGYHPHPRRTRRKPHPELGPPLHRRELPGQLDLFTTDPITATARRYGFPDPPGSLLASRLDSAVIDHGQRHGWGKDVTARVAMRVLLGMTGTAAPPIRSSDVDRLIALELPARSVRAVLAELRMLTEDRPSPVQTWFEERIAGLPGPM
ncbi:MAG: hypothetical protein ACRDMI_14615, partial [Streptosporangiaceae bacterium]